MDAEITTLDENIVAALGNHFKLEDIQPFLRKSRSFEDDIKNFFEANSTIFYDEAAVLESASSSSEAVEQGAKDLKELR